ncbi:TetR family transcriptional regulator [Sphingobium sufflavum]|uniref:TetR family transcriptional regulator n=1 Tax=Sphingobium sufflavum TaxID=1129547 RepID=UPI001F18C92B|nr:TetR family transcriptional regulator [Sphingobium sufflavum]MCE7795441.1 TetR family transcriptional regulator [Sphingobium sufflavum]
MPHPAPRTVSTPIRHAIQQSDESIRALAARHGLNPKTVAKWRARSDTKDARRGPSSGRLLTPAEEASILAIRRYLPLSLDDSIATLGHRWPRLSRSALHRLLKRHGLSRTPRPELFDLPEAARHPGCFHIDIIPVMTAGARQYLFLAIEQNCGLIFGLLYPDATQAIARDFLSALADGSPAPVRLVLTSDRFQFTTPGNTVSGVVDVREALEKGTLTRAHPFEYACATRGIDHHLVPDHYPWGSDQAEKVAAATSGIEQMAAADFQVAQQALHVELGRHNDCPLPSLGHLSPGDWLAAAAERARTMELWDIEDMRTRPARSRRDSTREAILEAAHNLLARDGPEGLSLSEVARLAGVNRGTAYQHFRTRDRLIFATGRWMAEKLHHAAFAGRPPSAAALGDRGMASLAGRLVGFAMERPELCRAWMLQLLSTPDPSQDLFWRDYRTAIAALGTDGQKAGMERPMDPEVAAVAMLAGAFLWPTWAQSRATPPGTPDPASATRFAVEWLRIARTRK